jgi:LysR family transcriptional regulator, low CO2-responsive transcriptional regulator
MYAYRLQVFQAVAKHRSYSRAARDELHISQPAVSKHIRALEGELGVTLFQQAGRQIELTEAGHLVFQCAEQMRVLTGETRRALLELQGLQRGTLRLGASTTVGTYLLPALLAAYVQRYPGITVTLDISNTRGVIAGMRDRAWDLGLAANVPDQPPLRRQPYCLDSLLLIVPPQHRLAGRGTVPLAELGGEAWVLREPGSASRQAIEQALRAHHVPWQERLTLPSQEAVKQAVMAGVGIGMVSRLAVTPVEQQGMLCIVAIADVRVERQISVVQRTDTRLPAPAQAFLHVISQQQPHLADSRAR